MILYCRRPQGPSLESNWQINALLKLVFGDTLALFAVQMEKSMPGTCMEHKVIGLVEYKTKLLQVVGHQRWPRWLLSQNNQAMNIFNCFVCFLKQSQYTE